MTTKNYTVRRKFSVVLGWYTAMQGVKVFMTDDEKMALSWFERLTKTALRIGGDWELVLYDHDEKIGDEPDHNLIDRNGEQITNNLLYDCKVLKTLDFSELEES